MPVRASSCPIAPFLHLYTDAPEHASPAERADSHTRSADLVREAIASLKGRAFAERFVRCRGLEPHPSAAPASAPHATPPTLPPLHPADDVHPSHAQATELLAPYREALGPAYPTLHLLARWSIEHASQDDPAPHLLTTYWTLEEATGKTERTLMRHLVEDGHPWSSTVRHLLDLRHNFGELKDGDNRRPCIVGTVIRFFPRGRQSENARVKRWGERDLIAEADAGRTRACRAPRERYGRRPPRMSAYRSVREEARKHNWVLLHVGRSLEPVREDLATLYADIPDAHVLNALRADLSLAVERAETRGQSVRRARKRWVSLAARTLACRFGDDRPRDHVPLPEPRDGIAGYRVRNGRPIPVPVDGFTSLWRRALWAAVRTEAATGSTYPWMLLSRFTGLAVEARSLGKRRPVAWAWAVVKREGFEEVLRDDPGAGHHV